MPSTTTSFRLSPEARQAVGQELGMFEDLFAPSQSASMRQLLSLLSSSPATRSRATAAQQPLATMALAPNALQAAGQRAGLMGVAGGQQPLGDINQAVEYLRTTNPDVLNLRRQSALKNFGTNPSMVDPRYASFLKPVQSTNTEMSDWEQALNWLNIALGLGGAAAGAFGGTGTA